MKAAGRTITCVTGSQVGLDLTHCGKQEVPSRKALQVTGIEVCHRVTSGKALRLYEESGLYSVCKRGATEGDIVEELRKPGTESRRDQGEGRGE